MKKTKSPLLPDDKLDGCAMPRILAEFRACVVGQKITEVGYINLDGMPFPCLILENGFALIGQSDDCGNDRGTIYIANPIDKDRPNMLCRTVFATGKK